MSKHGMREQKRLAKKKAKRIDKKHHLARLNSSDPTVALAEAASWPVFASLAGANIWDRGLGQAVLARRYPDGRIACAVFLVDVFCLGVKNALWKIMAASEYQALLDRIGEVETLRRVSPEYVAKLVNCTADYAQSLGFAPHPDFRHARRLLAGIDPSLCTEEFTFGKGGKPFYVRGPHETPEKAQVIAQRIREMGGHFLIPLDPSTPLEDLDDAEIESTWKTARQLGDV